MRNILIAVGLLLLCSALAAESELDLLLSKASEYSPEYTVPVISDDGRPLSIVYDFNGDGLRDIAILTVVRQNDVPNGAAELRDSSRLYAARLEQPLYIIETYFQNDMAVQSVELGRKRVLADVDLMRLSANAGLPAAVSVSFRNADGIETHLLIYHSIGLVSRFTLHRNLSESAVIDDINQDGLTDLVIARRVPEAGQGYETFLDLYELAGDQYRRRVSVNIVRTLRGFVEEASELLTSGDWENLAKRVASYDPSDDPIAVVMGMFRPIELPDSEGMEPIEFNPAADVVNNVVYPGIMDNPFPFPYLGQTVSLTLRFDCAGNSSRLYEAQIRLSANVFTEAPYAFLTWDGS